MKKEYPDGLDKKPRGGLKKLVMG
ncbi:hypothetical protein LCGC14_2907500, partial [marine sediment metagenome]